MMYSSFVKPEAITKWIFFRGSQSIPTYKRNSSYEWSNRDIAVEELNGEAFNDAVFNRNQHLEETYGFRINVTSSKDTNMSDLSKLLLAGDDTYDAVFPQVRNAAGCAQQGLLLDLKTLKYLDFESGYWSSMYNDTLSIMNRMFYATGDISVNYRDSLFSIWFNKDMLGDYQLDDPYELVKSGKWTLDAIESMSLAAAGDLDGDSAMTLKDRWGLVFQSSESGIIFYYGAGEHVVDLDEEKKPYISLGGERSTAVFDRISGMMSQTQAIKTMSDSDVSNTFMDSRSLFMAIVIYHLMTHHAQDVTFGLLPVPKYDEAQQEYYQFADGWCISPACVPATAKNPETSGYILQTIAEASRKDVLPVYYDICLTRKYVRDEESSEMLDIIFKNCMLDNSDIFQWASFDSALKTAFIKGEGLQSLLEKNRSKLEGGIEKTIAAFEENT